MHFDLLVRKIQWEARILSIIRLYYLSYSCEIRSITLSTHRVNNNKLKVEEMQNIIKFIGVCNIIKSPVADTVCMYILKTIKQKLKLLNETNFGQLELIL